MAFCRLIEWAAFLSLILFLLCYGYYTFPRQCWYRETLGVQLCLLYMLRETNLRWLDRAWLVLKKTFSVGRERVARLGNPSEFTYSLCYLKLFFSLTVKAVDFSVTLFHINWHDFLCSFYQPCGEHSFLCPISLRDRGLGSYLEREHGTVEKSTVSGARQPGFNFLLYTLECYWNTWSFIFPHLVIEQ